ncbi:MAG TPA: hypothetical protein VG817_09345, partial [Gemmatimonadales bacterium]|nr:hypothetical protein [Gemmatimonadales bacterium]
MTARLSPEDLKRGEHPRPQLQRAHWRSLDGTWNFAFDPAAMHELPETVTFDRTIQVPFPPESRASGIGDTGYHNVLWYHRRVKLEPREMQGDLLLHFGAVDYQARVWVNGNLVAEHTGGHTPFSVAVGALRGRQNQFDLVVRAQDDPHDLAKPRGKQDWLADPHEIWYPRTSGIWQTVWLEVVPPLRIERLQWKPHLEDWSVGLEVLLSAPPENGTALRVVLHHEHAVLADDRYLVTGADIARRIALSDPGIEDYRNQLLWSPAHPTILEAELELLQGDRVLDSVWSYTALRSTGVQGNRFMLNGRPYYLRMVLDQGYWPETLLTPPDTGALRLDAELALDLGFNGVRKHQKL